MDNISKTFRFFISSTFSDFQVERGVLQTNIFPDIREYCSSKGYTFQPIDLRWGVSEEAQIDQKALEMCIQEVQSCKKHDYPNFLIMIGDRYGWVPLPNIIEKTEFEQILKDIASEDIEFLLSWYDIDANQVPTSYILKQRTNKYIDHDQWFEVESRLRSILQNVASNWNKHLKKKYFTSATEAEAIEGIISYSDKSEFQQKLLKLIPDLEQIDNRNIFGFFRNIDKNTAIDNKFISSDYHQAQTFKKKVEEQLVNENILNISTAQLTIEKLDEHYTTQFLSSVKDFLIRQIDAQILKDNELKSTSLEQEKLQQRYFMEQKLENFLGQEKVLNEIENYLKDTYDKPLVICGKSGIGKSSIIAKAIENTSITTSKKIIYRFIGATPNSMTSKKLLSSILDEIDQLLVVDYESNITEDSRADFVSFSDKVHDAIMNVQDDVVFFIDAVDQLSNDDQFLWLPSNLPANVKIIISALKDRNYKQDSRYFYALEDKFSRFIEIDPFNQPLELLERLLSHQNRTLQDRQKDYFLDQYNQIQTPLYIYMAAYQMQYWKSQDSINTLESTQTEIIKRFISNLSDVFHHNRQLVQKTLGYILASKYGLSEYELLELLNTDQDFITHVAPDTWHINVSNKLPLVVWTRLHSQLKPFLSRKSQDGQDLLYFFHREFIDAIENQENQKEVHVSIIEATQKIIERNIDKEFENNRWGKLYVELLLEYFLKYEDEDIVKKYYDNIMLLADNDLRIKYLQYINKKRDESRINENNNAAEHLIDVSLHISNKYKHLSDEIYLKYLGGLHSRAEILATTKEFSSAIDIEENNVASFETLSNFSEIIKPRKLKDLELNKDNNDLDVKEKWLYLYLQIKQILGFAYVASQDRVNSLNFAKDAHSLLKSFYDVNQDNIYIASLYYDQINYYSMALQINGVFFEAIDLLKDSLQFLEKNYHSDKKKIQFLDVYAKALYLLSGVSYKVRDESWHESFIKSYEIYKELMKYNFLKYSKSIIEMNNFFINNYDANQLFLQSEPYYKNNISLFNKQGNKSVEESIKAISDDLFVKVLELKKKEKQVELFFVNKRLIEYVFNFDKEYWAKSYVQKLIALGGLLNKSKIDDSQLSIALALQKEGVDICEQFMDEDDEWYDLYTKNMNNLANTYTYLNQHEEAYTLNTKNLDISTKLFNRDPQRWFRAYYYALENMDSIYMMRGDRDKREECKVKIKELESDPRFQYIKDVIKNKATDAKIQFADYIAKGLLGLGIFFIFYYFIFE